MPMQTPEIAEEVRALLARRRISQRTLAERLGWTQSQMSRRMSGSITFSATELADIADALEVPVESLYGRPAGFIAEPETAAAS